MQPKSEKNLLQGTQFKREYDLNEEFRVTAVTTVKIYSKRDDDVDQVQIYRHKKAR